MDNTNFDEYRRNENPYYYLKIAGYAHRIAKLKLGRNLQRVIAPTDIAQSVAATVIRRLPSFRGTGEKTFFGWVGRITRNKIAAVAREASRMHHISMDSLPEIPGNALTPGESAEASERQIKFLALLESLPEEEQNVMNYRYEHNMNYEAIGEKLGISGEGARLKLRRVEDKLRRMSRNLG